MNILLLNKLRDAQGAYLSLETLGLDAQAVDQDLNALVAFGFLIERHPVFGVAYRGPAGRLCPDQIEAGLNTLRIGRQVAVWSRIASTSTLRRVLRGRSPTKVSWFSPKSKPPAAGVEAGSGRHRAEPAF